jgi:hypothetical protein
MINSKWISVNGVCYSYSYNFSDILELFVNEK